MTKEKIRQVIKRFPYIIKMINQGIDVKTVYINKRRVRIENDEEVIAIVKIMDEIIEREKEDWIKQMLQDLKKGKKDISIIIRIPAEKGKYYAMKERLINKIYECCIFKGLVSYEDIFKDGIE